MHVAIFFFILSENDYIMPGRIDSMDYSLLVNLILSLVDPNDPLYHEGRDLISSGFAYSMLQFMFCLGVTVFPLFGG